MTNVQKALVAVLLWVGFVSVGGVALGLLRTSAGIGVFGGLLLASLPLFALAWLFFTDHARKTATLRHRQVYEPRDYLGATYMRDKRMSELTPDQRLNAHELWIRDNLAFMGSYHIEHYALLLSRLDSARTLAAKAGALQ